VRPEPGFSLYEGRTRGKRMKYTFSDEEEEYSDALGVRRSNRHSGRDTPVAPSGPTVTASGRQVRSRATGLYGETLHAGQVTDAPSPVTGDYGRSDASEEPQRPTRGNASAANGAPRGRKHIETYNSVDEMDDEDDATSWDGGDEDEDDAVQMDLNDDEDDDGEVSSEDDSPKSLVVRLRYSKGTFNPTEKPAPTSTAHAQTALAEKTSGSASSDPPPVANALPPTPAPAPAQPATALHPQTAASYLQNGVATQQPLSFATGVQQMSSPPGNGMVPPKVESHLSVPTPPYVAPMEDADTITVHQRGLQSVAAPPYQPDALPPNPFQPSPLPHPTPASSWQ
jgi:hypothetical protein